jgi:hypothetical protein
MPNVMAHPAVGEELDLEAIVARFDEDEEDAGWTEGESDDDWDDEDDDLDDDDDWDEDDEDWEDDDDEGWESGDDDWGEDEA